MRHFAVDIFYLPVFFFVSSITITESDGANILGIFPTASYSHQQPLLVLSRALALKGHNVTIATTDPYKEPIKNLKQYDLSSLYEDWKKMQKGVISLQERNSPWQLIGNICNWSKNTTGAILENPEFKHFLREASSEKYDLILYESLGYSSLLGIREFVGNPPVIGIITLHSFNIADDPMGNPSVPSYAPQVFLGLDDRMTFWERFENVIIYLYSNYMFHKCMFSVQQEYLNTYFGNVKRTAEELEHDKSLLIVSTDLATGYPKPIQPNTIYVGPMHVEEKPKPLPQDLQKWMDGAEDGVIYFSLGSNMKGTSVPEKIRSAFIKAFERLPKIRVLWKWEADTNLPGQPNNVLVRKWLPQKSIFAHPKLKVFISQGGLQSFQEAVENAVPILVIPLFGDQDFNARKIVRSGAGLRLEFNEITYEEVYEKLKSLLTDTSYKKNMQRLSFITKDKPMSAIDTAIWWVEYVLRHNGAPHLRPAALDLVWYQYYMLDILSVVLCLILIILLTTYYVLKTLLRFYFIYCNKNIKVKRN